MFRTLSLLIVVATCGCSGPTLDPAIYHDVYDAEVTLTQEFTASLRLLVSEDGKPIPPPDPNEPPVAVAPEGAIKLDGKTYDFYPGFLRRGDVTWQSEVTIQFFRSMYPLDGTPSLDPADFCPVE